MGWRPIGPIRRLLATILVVVFGGLAYVTPAIMAPVLKGPAWWDVVRAGVVVLFFAGLALSMAVAAVTGRSPENVAKALLTLFISP